MNMDEHGPVISCHDSLHLVSNKSAKPLPILAACVQPQNVEQICPQRFDSQCWLLAKDARPARLLDWDIRGKVPGGN